MCIEISALRELPEQAGALAQRARDEGHAHLDRLIDDFTGNRNRFDAAGEALFAACRNGALVAIGGLNRDPYDSRMDAGRVRRLYVRPDARRCGIASALVAEIEARAAANGWRRLNLYTDSRAAAQFYAGLGYTAVAGINKISHTKLLQS